MNLVLSRRGVGGEFRFPANREIRFLSPTVTLGSRINQKCASPCSDLLKDVHRTSPASRMRDSWVAYLGSGPNVFATLRPVLPSRALVPGPLDSKETILRFQDSSPITARMIYPSSLCAGVLARYRPRTSEAKRLVRQFYCQCATLLGSVPSAPYTSWASRQA